MKVADTVALENTTQFTQTAGPDYAGVREGYVASLAKMQDLHGKYLAKLCLNQNGLLSYLMTDGTEGVI